MSEVYIPVIAMMSLRDDGNTEFRQGNWLKAAALYTKAIKADPESAVLYRYAEDGLNAASYRDECDQLL